jgi:hypothetical protein
VRVQGQILTEYEAGAWGYVLPDAFGSVRQLVDAAGQVTLVQSYDPLGTRVGGCHPPQPCIDPIPQVPGTTEDWSRISTGLDILALLVDSYGDIVVISAGVFGVMVGVPAGGQVELTGLAGVAFAETLTAGTTVPIGNWVATGATAATIVADVKACKTRLEDSHLTLGVSTLNGLYWTTSGWVAPPETFLSTMLQSIAVANDLGWVTWPFEEPLTIP